jgi:phosphatidylserine/phosphatidylglycerophosphate/cardiolipin synthase-like enzyme
MITDSLRHEHCILSLVTRPPREAWHRAAINQLQEQIPLALYFCASLHTKLYLIECDDFDYALMGSPNLTERADRLNFELAIEFSAISRGSAAVPRLLRDLKGYVRDLVAQDEVELQDIDPRQ